MFIDRVKYGTYYINPSQWDPVIDVVELSPRILTYLRSPSFEGGTYEALLKRWAAKIEEVGKPIKLNIHGPYGRPTTHPLERWKEILKALEPVLEAVLKVKGLAVVTFYDRFKTHEDVRVFSKIARILEDMGVPVALRPTLWYFPKDLIHKRLTGIYTTIDFAKLYGYGVNLDPENVFARLYVKLDNKKRAWELTEKIMLDIARVNKLNGIPQFGRFAPFKILRKGARLGKTTVRVIALKVTLPWSKREESILSVEHQLGYIARAVKEFENESYIVYNSTKDPEEVRERVVLKEVRKLLPEMIVATIK